MSMTYDEKAVAEVETTASVIETVAGIAVVVLSIIGLARADTRVLMSISTIILGVALLAQRGAIVAEYVKLLNKTAGGALGAVEFSGGIMVEMLAGGSAIVLGVLGLIGLAPELLIPAAVITIGASLILDARGSGRLNALRAQAAGLSDMAQSVVEAATAGAVSAQVLAGGAAVVLGIIAFANTSHTAVLTLVGLLVLGASVGVSGAALTGQAARLFSTKHA